ncbi:membrane lipoprotein lipid attachment site-containing protein [Marinobacter sp.]|uniref:membrane lipoprotein lipid attachment site-containing protein n=1 Tax=Marinobacter sp. TaxID=50741 RepID=UPI001B7BC433|nr:membrane lipoprotein lipid attachment site-containing protein [Marinobacter sp.]MBQ0831176.1 membrane lipoprotein lipid attachment site-containing protein [Marinobacter sp.]
MKRIALALFVVLALAGCKDRVIWDDKGKIDEKTQNREVWDSNGKMNTEDREFWVNKDGEKVVK